MVGRTPCCNNHSTIAEEHVAPQAVHDSSVMENVENPTTNPNNLPGFGASQTKEAAPAAGQKAAPAAGQKAAPAADQKAAPAAAEKAAPAAPKAPAQPAN